MTKGHFINLEGINHCGKTIQTSLLTRYLKKKLGDKLVISDREPTGRTLGRIIRELIERRVPSPVSLYEARGYLKEQVGDILDCEFVKKIEDIILKIERHEKIDELEIQVLFLADRCDHIMHIIEPSLARGNFFIGDRFDLSTFGYGIASGISFETLYHWHKLSVGKLNLIPDILIFIDIKAEESMRRLRLAIDTILDIHEESFERLERTADAYSLLLKHGNAWKIFGREVVFIAGMRQIEEVAGRIKEVIDRKFFNKL